MSDITKGTDVYGWRIYKLAAYDVKAQILREMDLDKNLLQVTWEGQVCMLDGAPDEILLEYLPRVWWRAQIKLYHQITAQNLERAESLLDPRARRTLGIKDDCKMISYGTYEKYVRNKS